MFRQKNILRRKAKYLITNTKYICRAFSLYIKSEFVNYALLVLYFLFALPACSSINTIYNEDVKLSRTRAFSEELGFSVSLPDNWRKVDANSDEQIQLLLVNPQNNLSISFRSLNLDLKPASKRNANLLKITDIFKTSLKTGNFSKVQNEEFFEYGGVKFSSFEIESENHQKRIVLFEYHNNYLECTALSMKGTAANEYLYSTQNKVLFSID